MTIQFNEEDDDDKEENGATAMEVEVNYDGTSEQDRRWIARKKLHNQIQEILEDCGLKDARPMKMAQEDILTLLAAMN